MSDEYTMALTRRFKEELARAGYPTENSAAERLGRVKQWLNARQRGETPWGVADLHWSCERLGLNFMYIVTGQRKADIAAELLAAMVRGQPANGDTHGRDSLFRGSLPEIFEHYFGEERR